MDCKDGTSPNSRPDSPSPHQEEVMLELKRRA